MPIPSAALRGLRGNLLSDGVRTFTYDAANRLTSVTSGTLTTAFEYDGLGNRTAQTVDGVTTEYVLDVAGGLPEVIVATTGGASTRYVQVQGQILAQQDSGAWTHILADHLGSVRQLVGSDGQVDLAQSYDPFGVPFETSGSGESDFGYTGERWDSEAALLYLRARYYDPYLNRFISPDTIIPDFENPQSLNRYSYVVNNPVRFVDPSGHQGCQGQDCALHPYLESFVKDNASTFGVPWQLVAGVLKSEMEMDTELRDRAEDLFWLLGRWPLTNLALQWKPDPGPGIGNVHVRTAKVISEYFAGCDSESTSMQEIRHESTPRIAYMLIFDNTNIEIVAGYIRMLADYRFGSDGQPLTTDHSNLADWTIVDAAAVWHGYRYGVPDVSPDPGRGFVSLEDFQDRSYSIYKLAFFMARGPDATNSIIGSIPHFLYYFGRRD
jgi:RHS repeat-associated protein